MKVTYDLICILDPYSPTYYNHPRILNKDHIEYERKKVLINCLIEIKSIIQEYKRVN